MTVEQDMRLVGGAVHMAHDHGVTGGGAFGGLDADAVQIFDQPIGGAVAVFLERGVSRDGGDAQQIEQPVGGRIQIMIDPCQYVG